MENTAATGDKVLLFERQDRDRVDSIATRYQLDGPGIESR